MTRLRDRRPPVARPLPSTSSFTLTAVRSFTVAAQWHVRAPEPTARAPWRWV